MKPDKTFVVRIPLDDCPCRGSVYAEGVEASDNEERFLLAALAHRAGMKSDEPMKILAAAMLAHMTGEITIIAAELASVLPKKPEMKH